jgi:hypothetical protein
MVFDTFFLLFRAEFGWLGDEIIPFDKLGLPNRVVFGMGLVIPIKLEGT